MELTLTKYVGRWIRRSFHVVCKCECLFVRASPDGHIPLCQLLRAEWPHSHSDQNCLFLFACFPCPHREGAERARRCKVTCPTWSCQRGHGLRRSYFKMGPECALRFPYLTMSSWRRVGPNWASNLRKGDFSYVPTHALEPDAKYFLLKGGLEDEEYELPCTLKRNA
jgi:hypothetical protein